MLDMHTHSTCSDGTVSARDLVKQAAQLRREGGVAGIAITDHDTADGWASAADEAVRSGVTLFRGVEMSCAVRGLSVHLLSYLHRRDDAALAEELTLARDSRLTRAERMVASIATEYPLTWADVCAHVQPGATVGRPHIADALVAAGYFRDRDEVFADVLSNSSRHYLRYYAPHPVDAIRLIRAAGGVPVLAHGLAVKRGRTLSVDQIEELVDAGLAGIEIYHREHSADAVATLEALAARRDLIVTGSSDYHGTGKPNQLGENLTSAAMAARIAELGTTQVLWA